MSEKNPSGAPDQDIIELTDVIEEPVLAEGGATSEAEGMDMGFQQELDDLFAEGGVAGDAKPAAASGPAEPLEPAQAAAEAPQDDLDLSDLEGGADFDLRLPEEAPAQSAATTAAQTDDHGIDVAGLDALLREGPAAAATAAGDAPDQYPPIESVGLDDLDSLLAGADLEPDLGETMTGAGPQDEDLIDLDSLMTESDLEQPYSPEPGAADQAAEPSPDDVAERLSAIESKLEQIAAAQHLAIMDLADSLKMAKTPNIDLDALAAALEPALARMLTSGPTLDRAQEIFDARMSVLEGTLAGSLAALVEKILDDRLESAAQAPAAAPDMAETAATVTAAVTEALQSQLAGLREDVLAQMRALAPDAQAIKDELRAEIEQAVPAAAAQIIREEIAALAAETD
jgi:uncharacterized protein YciI